MGDEELNNMRTYFGISEHKPRVLPYVTVTLEQVAKYVASRDQQIALAARIDEPKPNTKEYLKLHSVKQPYTIHDIGYMEQLIRYHESVAIQLRKEINQLREK